MATNQLPDAYIPGVCNINTAEIARRRKFGYVGTAIFVILLVILLLTGADRLARIVLLIPGALLANGFLQAKNKFCVGYGAAGKQNATEGSTTAASIEDTTALAKDKRRVRQINLQTAAVSIVLTLLALAIPQ